MRPRISLVDALVTALALLVAIGMALMVVAALEETRRAIREAFGVFQ
jgi:hypothetical protein